MRQSQAKVVPSTSALGRMLHMKWSDSNIYQSNRDQYKHQWKRMNVLRKWPGYIFQSHFTSPQGKRGPRTFKKSVRENVHQTNKQKKKMKKFPSVSRQELELEN